MALGGINKTLVTNYEWVWVDDPCWQKEPAEDWDKAWADYQRTGDWSTLPRHGEPTVFEIGHLGGTATAAVKDVATAMGGPYKAARLAARVALRAIRNPDVELAFEFDRRTECNVVTEEAMDALPASWRPVIEALGLAAYERTKPDPLSSTDSG